MAAKVGLITMQKDEGPLLEFWYQYYSGLFGPENLTLIDNGSTDALTLGVLKTLRAAGVTVVSDPRREAFEQKGLLCLQRARALFSQGFDYVYLADADEYLVYRQGSVPVLQRELTLGEFTTEEDGFLIRVGAGWFNILGTDQLCFDELGQKKLAFSRRLPRDFVMDVGFHGWNWEQRTEVFPRVRQANLGVIHFHYKPYDRYVAAAREKLKDRVPDFAPDTLRKYQGPGIHLIPRMLMNESEYNQSFRSIGGKLTDGRKLFAEAGLGYPYESVRRG